MRTLGTQGPVVSAQVLGEGGIHTYFGSCWRLWRWAGGWSLEALGHIAPLWTLMWWNTRPHPLKAPPRLRVQPGRPG